MEFHFCAGSILEITGSHGPGNTNTPLPQLTLSLSHSLTKRAEAGLWDHRKAGGRGTKPGASDQIPWMGSCCFSQPDSSSAGPEEWVQVNPEPVLIV